MNILICNNRYFPSSGPERYLFAVTALLESHGHTVVPFAANYSQTVETPYRRYFPPPPVDGDSVYYSQYKKSLTIRKRIDLVARATYSRTVREAASRAVREQQIDLVYLLNTVNVLSPSIIDAARSGDVPVALRLSDFNLLCPAYAFLRDGQVCQECLGGYHHALQHRCLQGSLAVTAARVFAMSAHNVLGIYKHVGAFIAPSRYMAKQMEHFTPARGRIHYIPSFVDQSLLELHSPRGSASPAAPAESRPYVLYFGRVSADKGLDILVQAAAGLDRDVDIVIAGESKDEYRQQLQELGRSLSVSTMRFVSFVSGAPLSTLIRGALCVVAPSIWHDNAPMSVHESLAHGKAVIGSDVGGISDQLDEGCGVLVPAGDTAALRQAIRLLVDKPELTKQLEQAALRRARTTYAPEQHYERLMAVFASLRSSAGETASKAGTP